jgi:hypothetical protein
MNLIFSPRNISGAFLFKHNNGSVIKKMGVRMTEEKKCLPDFYTIAVMKS